MSRWYRFLNAMLLPELRQVLVANVPATLGARAFDVLMLLVEHRDRILSKDELLAQVWANVVVEENNLATQISSLRKVLGPSAITTIPGRGYQFTAAVVEVNDECEFTSGAATQPGSGRVSPRGSRDYTDRNKHSRPAFQAATAELGNAADFNEVLPPAPILGRAEALADLLQALTAQPGCVTLLGAGGIGKTALARWVAEAWRRPAHPAHSRSIVWLDLLPVRDAEGLVHALARAVAPGATLPTWPGVEVNNMAEAARWLARLPHEPEALWVLDNAEHLREPLAQWLTLLLPSLPGLRVLVTSQAPLGCPQERRFPLGPLALPAPDADLAAARQTGALALFEHAARQLDARFVLDAGNLPLARQLVQALGGVPLALKLAAARLPLLGLPGLTAALDQRLSLLAAPADRPGAADAPDAARHRTLKATLDWSHNLLSPEEKRLFRRLGVCRGEFSLPLAQLLAQADDDLAPACDDPDLPPPEPTLTPDAMDTLAGLVDRSLVELARGDGLPTYRLPETHRLYAGWQLELRGETEAVHRHHAQAMHRLMAVAEARYWHDPDDAWLARQRGELDNLRAALDWSGLHDPALAASLLGLSSFVFLQAGLAGEARRRWEAVAGRLDDRLAPATAAHFLLVGSRLLWGLDGPRMLALAGQARQAAQAAGRPRLAYLALRCALGSGALPANEVAPALADMARLENSRWPARLRSQRLLAQVDSLALAGDDLPPTVAALCAAREGLRAVVEPAGLSTLTMLAHLGLAESDWLAGHPDAALARCARLLSDSRLVGNQRLQVLACQAAVHLSRNDAASARASLQAWARLGAQRDWEWFDRYADLFAWLAALEGRHALAQAVAHHADAAALSSGGRRGPARQRAGLRMQAALADAPTDAPADGAEVPWLAGAADICAQLGLLAAPA